MSWARLDDAILDNPKISAAGPLGFALHVAAITWCARNLTNGLIPKTRAHCLLPGEWTDIAQHLLVCELWHDCGVNYELHDFLDFNFSREQVQKRRQSTQMRVKRHRNGVTNAAVTHLPGPVPVPEKKILAIARKRATQWPDTLHLTPERTLWAHQLGVDPAEWNAFRDHHQAKGSRFVDWDAAWRTWLRRAPQFGRRKA